MKNNIVNMDKVPQSEIDKEILRTIMIEELKAINLYEQMCYNTSNKDIKKVLKDIMEDEREHFEEAEDMLETIEGEVEEEDEDEDEDEDKDK